MKCKNCEETMLGRHHYKDFCSQRCLRLYRALEQCADLLKKDGRDPYSDIEITFANIWECADATATLLEDLGWDLKY